MRSYACMTSIFEKRQMYDHWQDEIYNIFIDSTKIIQIYSYITGFQDSSLLDKQQNKGNKTGVFLLYSKQSALLPHFLSARYSKILTPDTNIIKQKMKRGLIRDKNSHLDRAGIAYNDAPTQMIISPIQLGCREIDQRPVVINFPLLSSRELNQDFCLSAITSNNSPRAQTPIPKPFRIPIESTEGSLDSFVITTKRGLMVTRTHNPWNIQTVKNFSLDFFISQNRLSSPFDRTLIKRKRLSLIAQMATIAAAMYCWAVAPLWVKVAMRVIERKVSPPVRSKNLSVLQMAEGMNTNICRAKAYPASSQKMCMSHSDRDYIPTEYPKAVPKPRSTTTAIRSLNIRLFKFQFIIEQTNQSQLFHYFFMILNHDYEQYNNHINRISYSGSFCLCKTKQKNKTCLI